MTSIERIKTAFAHKEPDKVPLGEMHIVSQVAGEILGREAITVQSGWGIKKQVEMIIAGRRDEYVDRKKVDILDVYEKLDLDLITIELDPPKSSPIVYKDFTERGWIAVNERTGAWSKYLFDEDSDTELEVESSIKEGGLDAIKRHLDIMEASGFKADESLFDSTKFIIENNKSNRGIMVKIPNVIPTGLSWFPLYMEMMYLDPEMTQRLADLYLKKAMVLAKRMIELGADVLLICSDWAYNSGPMVSPELIKKYWIPQISALAELCHEHGVYLMKHTDGNIMKIADDFINMGIDGYQGLEPNAGMDLKEMKQKYGDKVLFMGNADCATILPFGTKEQVVEETKRCLRDGAPGGGFILASCNTIQAGIPVKNYLTMIETAHKYRAYPISL